MNYITNIENYITELNKSKDYTIYEALEYELHLFEIEVIEKQSKFDIMASNMNREKAKYQVANREKYNSDRTASSHFKVENHERIHKFEIIEAEVKLLTSKLKSYQRMADNYKSYFIRDLAIAKRTV